MNRALALLLASGMAACGATVIIDGSPRDEAPPTSSSGGPSSGCAIAGQSCLDTECCSEQSCVDFVCEESLCTPDGAPCTTDSQCCWQTCVGGSCGPEVDDSECQTCAYAFDGALTEPQLVSYTCSSVYELPYYVCSGVPRDSFQRLQDCACKEACQPVCCGGFLECGGGNESTQGCGACVATDCADELMACATN